MSTISRHLTAHTVKPFTDAADNYGQLHRTWGTAFTANIAIYPTAAEPVNTPDYVQHDAIGITTDTNVAVGCWIADGNDYYEVIRILDNDRCRQLFLRLTHESVTR